MTEPDDDLTAALRRELAAASVPYDDDRADAMVRTATAADPLAARNWQAPVAAAAAVVVVGGGAAALVAARHTHGSASDSTSTPIGAPARTETPVPTRTPFETPPPRASMSSVPGRILVDLVARPGTTTTQLALPAVTRSALVGNAHFVRVSGSAGSIAVYRGEVLTAMNDDLDFTDETVTPNHPLRFAPGAPLVVRLTCAGSTTCNVEVTLATLPTR